MSSLVRRVEAFAFSQLAGRRKVLDDLKHAHTKWMHTCEYKMIQSNAFSSRCSGGSNENFQLLHRSTKKLTLTTSGPPQPQVQPQGPPPSPSPPPNTSVSVAVAECEASSPSWAATAATGEPQVVANPRVTQWNYWLCLSAQGWVGGVLGQLRHIFM